MKSYIAKVVIELFAGLVKLSQDQARRRRHNLKKVDDGAYEIVKPIQFKAGEEFSHDGDIPKRLAQDVCAVEPEVAVEEVIEPKPAPKPKRKPGRPKTKR